MALILSITKSLPNAKHSMGGASNITRVAKNGDGHASETIQAQRANIAIVPSNVRKLN